MDDVESTCSSEVVDGGGVMGVRRKWVPWMRMSADIRDNGASVGGDDEGESKKFETKRLNVARAAERGGRGYSEEEGDAVISVVVVVLVQ